MRKKSAELIIEAGRAERQYWKDLWSYRELFLYLTWRDIKVRYKQTVMGVAWSVIRPVFSMIVFTIIFGTIAKLPSNGIPYPLLVFSAMLPWQFFSNAMSSCSGSLVANSGMISKIYFPRLIVPSSSVIVSLVDFFISFIILIIMMFAYNVLPTSRMLFLPLMLLLASGAAMGVGLWLAALTVKYRDFRFVVPFLVQFGLYISPVGFTSAIVPEQWKFLYSLNPIVGVIEGFRWSILGGKSHIYWPGLLLSIGLVILLLISGVWYFRKTEKTFADVI